MKRFFLMMLSIWRQHISFYIIATVTGALIGVFVLAPSYNYISAYEQGTDSGSSIGYIFSQIQNILTGKSSHDSFELIIFYAEIGAILGLLAMILYKFIHERLLDIDYLKTELDKDLASIIRQGEGP